MNRMKQLAGCHALLVSLVCAAGCPAKTPHEATSPSDAGTVRDDAGEPDSGRRGQDAAGPTEPSDLPMLSAEERAALLSFSPIDLPPPPPDVSNAYADDPLAALFGQKLFFDTRFSGALLDGDNDGSVHALGLRGETGRVACAGCHVPAAGFSDDRTLGGAISLGTGWGRRRTPSLLDVGQVKLLMWDGRHDAFFNQVFGPFESAVEMNSSRLFVAEQVFALYRSDYEAIFGALPALDDPSRFPPITAARTGCQHVNNTPTPPVCDGSKHGYPGDGAEFDAMSQVDQDAVTQVVVNLGKALGAYQRLLTCGPSRFDAWMHGDADALSPAEQRGAVLFVGKARCVTCHAGPYFSDHSFHNVGLRPATVSLVFSAQNDSGALTGLAAAKADPLNVQGKFSDGDDGRLGLPASTKLDGSFRTAMLRCVDQRPRFMHTGQMLTLEEVIAFFNRGGDTGGFPGSSELTPLQLTAPEQADLAQFLRALRGPGPAAGLLQ